MAPGDLLLTGTPGGTALKAPAKAAEKLAALLPPATRWKLFFGRQARNPRYLRDGDVIAATIASADGRLEPRHPAQHRDREDAMTAPDILPLPDSTYQLLLDAARTLARQRRNAMDPGPQRLHALPDAGPTPTWPAR